ncbi:MAG: hypothetical protein E7383_09455 [Ruminococcaceae bacterium]|nr:hypothetical protein [Oscillospiraceae bacterium]
MTNPNKKNTKVQAQDNKVELDFDQFMAIATAVSTLVDMHMTLIEFYREESELKKHHRAYLHVREAAEETIGDDLEVIPEILNTLSGVLSSRVHCGCPDCKVTELPIAEADASEEKANNDDPCVIMKLDDLYAMQKDMIDLTDAIDLMAKYYVATKYQAPVNKQKYDDTVHNAKALAEEVFTRWENSTIEEIK